VLHAGDHPHTLQPVVPDHIDISPEYDLCDEEIKERLANMFRHDLPRAQQSPKRNALIQQIEASGMTLIDDDFDDFEDFHLNE